MDSYLSNKSDQQETVEVEDLKKDLSTDFSMLQQSSIEEQEHLKVYLRVRPFTSAESSNGESQECVNIEPPDTVLLKLPSVSVPARGSREKSLPQTGQRFQFSQVYGPETTQTKLFEGTVKKLVKDVLEGGNSLVFTYGVTNAGKTFTFLGPDADAGILPRSLHMIFSSIGQRVFSGASVKPHRCREFARLSRAQQADDALFKRNLFRQHKENDKSNASLLNCTYKDVLEGSEAETIEDRISLHVDTNTTFSVWVSFCEIYNENIHDLLEATPNGALRRTALRLSQDIKGNAYVKDLRWVQVNSAQEAYTVMKLGKKNQSFSSTRLNQLSSRSHSIFSIRILRIEDIAGTPRVHTVSELCLCDLAGSERCAKTQNKGDRLKEAGNINTSLLILGKCINALRHNQQAKFLQHVPFRESKLTHYLQSFFCGRGAACMIVNINQCASMYDETLNVLKFSAVAQKVVVLSSRALPITSQRSSSEVSFTINNAGKKAPHSRRSSSLIGWDSSLEDVQEDEDDDDCDEGSVIDDTMDEGSDEDDNIEADKVVICKETHQRQGALLRQLQVELKKQEAQGLLIEARVREEVSQEFSELFSEMRTDFDERLAREREILEERSERRLEIFKNLVDQISSSVPRQDTHAMVTQSLYEILNEECFLESFSSELTGAERLSEAAFPGRRPGAGKDVESGNLLTQLQEKSSQCAQLEESVESLKKRLELNMQPQEALAASEPEKPFQLDNRAREELEAEVEQLRRRKEELQSTLAEEREMRERAEAALQAERRREAADELAEEKPHREDEVQSALTKEKEELRERWDTAQQQLVMAAERADNIMVELRSAQEQMEQRSKEIQEKSSHILNLQQERDGLKQELHAAKITSACSSDELREESDELRRKLSLERERHDSAERRAQQLEGEVADLKQQLLEATQRLRPRVDIQQAEVAKAVEPLGLSMENAELLDEVASLRTKVSALEETQELKEKEAEEKLQDQAAHITSLQKAQQERREDEEVERNAAQEARRAETERRRELLAVAHEAIAQKEAELQRRVEEISSLKESVRQESEKAEKFNRDLQRREDDSSELREKLSDYKKQMEQVQKEISVMREEEKSLGQKLADAEKTKKQLLSELAVRDRTIQQIKAEQTGNHQELHQKACRELEAKERVMEEMRLALTEQEDTQQQMETMLDEKLTLIHQLHHEVEKLKAELQQSNGGVITASLAEAPSDDITVLKQEAAQAEENLKTQMEKHQAERRKWLEEKLSLIGQAKEAEHRRNQEMRKFAEDRERYVRQQRELESQLTERDQSLDEWRKERDTLVAALEVQLQKLLSSQAEKEAQLQQLRCSNNHPPPEVGSTAAELQVVLTEKEAQISQLKMELEASRSKMEETKAESSESASRTSGGKDTRVSVSSQSSAGGSVVLDSFEISTESGRRSRFPKPELEIAFSSLQPNRMALRRQGEESAVTVKITRSARKRKSGEMEKSHIFRRSKRKTKPQEDVEVENRKNTTTRLTHQDESFSPTTRLNARRKEGTLQKIGDFLQSSPTLLGSKAKKMMSLVSGRSDADASSSGSSSSLSRRANKTKRKLYRPEISSPMEMSPHTIISREPEEKESDHQIIKRRLRSRIVK